MLKLAIHFTNKIHNIKKLTKHKADESFKDDINNEINSLTNELKQLLNNDLKLQNEQPQQTTQPEQTQETENAALKTEVENLKAKVASMEKDSTEAKALLTELRALKSSFNIPPRTVADPKPGEVKTDAQAKTDERKAKYQPKKA